ncbi:hypothetical protein HGRIS_011753 [Hohenbuehelia grisea]|uniref:F-box domain-containing protein n=1 Tax=Hohenbuehelia grisea TaxID=104357 RepID=A0ABR3JX58_9AGAR
MLEAREDIDRQIAIHETRIAQHNDAILLLKSQRNQHAFISRLPTETLIRIFEETAHVDAATLSRSSGQTESSERRVECMGFTQVCRQWRMIALDSPTIWRSICLKHPEKWIAEQMSRSQSKPLFLWHAFDSERLGVPDGDCIQTPFPHSAFSEPWRVERIRINTTQDNIPSCDGLRQPHPILRRATISYPIAIQFLDNSLPDDIFGRSAPRLRKLCTLGCIPPWTSPIMQGLTSLVVLSLNDRLSDSWPVRDDLSTWNGYVLLNHLRLIELVGHRESCHILRHLECPNVSTARLDMDSNFQKEDLAFEGVCRLGAIVAGGFSAIESLQFSRAFTGWSIKLQGCGRRSRGLSFKFHNDELLSNYPDSLLVVKFCEALLLEQLHKLQVENFPQLRTIDWNRIFACTPSLTWVSVSPYSYGFMDALSSMSSSSHVRRSAVILPLPQLQTLAVKSCRFTGAFYSDRYAALKNAVLVRVSRGQANTLRELHISDCRITRTKIRDLRSILPVKWDGYTRGHPDWSSIPVEEMQSGDESDCPPGDGDGHGRKSGSDIGEAGSDAAINRSDDD